MPITIKDETPKPKTWQVEKLILMSPDGDSCSDKNKNMNLQKKLSAIQAETAAANARAAACKRRTLELKIQSLKMELKLRKLLATPNFPEETKQRILAQLRKLNCED